MNGRHKAATLTHCFSNYNLTTSCLFMKASLSCATNCQLLRRTNCSDFHSIRFANDLWKLWSNLQWWTSVMKSSVSEPSLAFSYGHPVPKHNHWHLPHTHPSPHCPGYACGLLRNDAVINWFCWVGWRMHSNFRANELGESPPRSEIRSLIDLPEHDRFFRQQRTEQNSFASF
jgi:hypothetical protein